MLSSSTLLLITNIQNPRLEARGPVTTVPQLNETEQVPEYQTHGSTGSVTIPKYNGRLVAVSRTGAHIIRIRYLNTEFLGVKYHFFAISATIGSV